MSTGSRLFSFDSHVALIEFRSVGFCGGRKTNKKNPEKNPQKKARGPLVFQFFTVTCLPSLNKVDYYYYYKNLQQTQLSFNIRGPGFKPRPQW